MAFLIAFLVFVSCMSYFAAKVFIAGPATEKEKAYAAGFFLVSLLSGGSALTLLAFLAARALEVTQ